MLWEGFVALKGQTGYCEFHRALRENRTVVFEEYYAPYQTLSEVRAYPSEEGLTVCFRDVTEARKTEESLRVSEERFRTIARATTDVVWDWDLEADSLWTSDSIEPVFGYTMADGSRPPGFVASKRLRRKRQNATQFKSFLRSFRLKSRATRLPKYQECEHQILCLRLVVRPVHWFKAVSGHRLSASCDSDGSARLVCAQHIDRAHKLSTGLRLALPDCATFTGQRRRFLAPACCCHLKQRKCVANLPVWIFQRRQMTSRVRHAAGAIDCVSLCDVSSALYRIRLKVQVVDKVLLLANCSKTKFRLQAIGSQ